MKLATDEWTAEVVLVVSYGSSSLSLLVYCCCCCECGHPTSGSFHANDIETCRIAYLLIRMSTSMMLILTELGG